MKKKIPFITMSCEHREDVCQHCLEKVQTTTEDSPPPKKDILSWEGKLLLMPLVSSFLAASGVLWVINTKIIYKAAKIALELIVTPTE